MNETHLVAGALVSVPCACAHVSVCFISSWQYYHEAGAIYIFIRRREKQGPERLSPLAKATQL